MNETRDDIIKNSKEILGILPQEEVGARFEYRCAKQAAKCLTPVESIRKKLFEHFLNIGEAAQGISPFGIIKMGVNLVKMSEKSGLLNGIFTFTNFDGFLQILKRKATLKILLEKDLKGFEAKAKNILYA
ncbi:hypothetical protein [Candidatus Protochlamydia amoebophila]|uniref:Uncharacterized protein n=1 Tax=Candidatus Protochlamydia amoebophila TaxID=362787 RepID=A0A0C1JID1_9BACT|nr:hypothetical protein [Candidatus Protochlamydia amoebophila]KIC71140.1 hypothetical protein DB44_EQ00060 [Candidatus Protochlamydia amoebophila]